MLAVCEIHFEYETVSEMDFTNNGLASCLYRVIHIDSSLLFLSIFIDRASIEVTLPLST